MQSASSENRQELFALAKKGREDCLGELLELYRNYLHLLARTQIDLHLAVRTSPSDIVQETFLQACQKFHHFRGGTQAELLSWLRRILVNNIAGAFEKHARAPKKRCAPRQIARSHDRQNRSLVAES